MKLWRGFGEALFKIKKPHTVHAYLYVVGLHRDFCDFGLVWSPYGIWMVDHFIYIYIYMAIRFARVCSSGRDGIVLQYYSYAGCAFQKGV